MWKKWALSNPDMAPHVTAVCGSMSRVMVNQNIVNFFEIMKFT
jgi:hypothetical protein